MANRYNHEYYKKRMENLEYAKAHSESSLRYYYKKKELEFENAIKDIYQAVEKSEDIKKVLPELMKKYKIIKRR